MYDDSIAIIFHNSSTCFITQNILGVLMIQILMGIYLLSSLVFAFAIADFVFKMSYIHGVFITGTYIAMKLIEIYFRSMKNSFAKELEEKLNEDSKN